MLFKTFTKSAFLLRVTLNQIFTCFYFTSELLLWNTVISRRSCFKYSYGTFLYH